MSFLEGLNARKQELLDNCIACGRCAEVCPMIEPAGLETNNPAALTRGIVSWIRDGVGSAEAAEWARVCSGSGNCIPACGYGVNPRFMLSLARLAVQSASLAEGERRHAGVESFRTVTQGARVLSRLQLSPELMARAEGHNTPADADTLLYTGCNVLKTPHIVLLCLDVLERLGRRVAVRGGSKHCCGVLHFQAGDPVAGGRLGTSSMARLADGGFSRALAWCPTCQIQFGEHVLPNHERSGNAPPITMEPFICFLASELEKLRPLMVCEVRKRVALHEHSGLNGATEAAHQLLAAIPGLEVIDLQERRLGYMCNTLNPLPRVKRQSHLELFERAKAAEVDTLVGIFHACHRDLCSHEREWPFEIVNIMELVGQSIGAEREDRFKLLKIIGDVGRIVEDCRDLIEAHGLSEEECRHVIARDLVGH